MFSNFKCSWSPTSPRKYWSIDTIPIDYYGILSFQQLQASLNPEITNIDKTFPASYIHKESRNRQAKKWRLSLHLHQQNPLPIPEIVPNGPLQWCSHSQTFLAWNYRLSLTFPNALSMVRDISQEAKRVGQFTAVSNQTRSSIVWSLCVCSSRYPYFESAQTLGRLEYTPCNWLSAFHFDLREHSKQWVMCLSFQRLSSEGVRASEILSNPCSFFSKISFFALQNISGAPWSHSFCTFTLHSSYSLADQVALERAWRDHGHSCLLSTSKSNTGVRTHGERHGKSREPRPNQGVAHAKNTTGTEAWLAPEKSINFKS